MSLSWVHLLHYCEGLLANMHIFVSERVIWCIIWNLGNRKELFYAFWEVQILCKIQRLVHIENMLRHCEKEIVTSNEKHVEYAIVSEQ